MRNSSMIHNSRFTIHGKFLWMVVAVVFAMGTAPGRTEVVEAVAKSVAGKVQWAKPGSANFEPLKAGEHLPVGSTIRTGADGVATVLTVPGAAIRVESGSELVLSELEFAKAEQKTTKRRAKLDLKSGTVSALIQNNEPEVTSFEVKTPHGVAAARGTFYGVSVDK